MASFLDGPARDVRLLLKRAPEFLRAVMAPGGEWDALDQLDDTPKATEKIVAYRMVGKSSRFHLCRSPRSMSGWYYEADYRVVCPQPADAEMRTTDAWRKWCTSQNREEEPVDPAPTQG